MGLEVEGEKGNIEPRASSRSSVNWRVHELVGELEDDPILTQQDRDGFSYDQRGVQYATLHTWSQYYGIPHTSFLRSINVDNLKAREGLDASGRISTKLYSEKDIVPVCVPLYHQAKLPILDQNQKCIIEGEEFTTRQGFSREFSQFSWPRVGRAAGIIEKNKGMKLAKYHPESGIPQFLKVFRVSALKHLLDINAPIPESLTSLCGEIGKRLGTIPLWAEYLSFSDEGLRLQLKSISPSKKVVVGNKRVQSAYGEDIILGVLQAIVTNSSSGIVIDSLEDWRQLPLAGETDRHGREIGDELREESSDLVDTTANWAYEFSTTGGAIEQLIKRRYLHVEGVFGRSGIRIVRLYSRALIKNIFDNKRVWGTNRKKKKRRATAD